MALAARACASSSENFPEEEKAIDNYINLVKKVTRGASGYFIQKTFPKWAKVMLSPFMGRTFLKYASKTTGEVLSTLTSNKKLAAVLCGQWGDYGLPPGQSPFS